MQKYNILELNEKLLPELQSIAEELGIKKISSLKKEELVYRILDEQAISYAGQQAEKEKEKEAKKKQREQNLETKEYRLSVSIDVGDFETKLRNAKAYIEKGHKIKVSVRFKGRQLAHPELGRDVIMKFASKLDDVAVIEQMPKLEGRSMQLFLAPKK